MDARMYPCGRGRYENNKEYQRISDDVEYP
jgi:hypothetical protein